MDTPQRTTKVRRRWVRHALRTFIFGAVALVALSVFAVVEKRPELSHVGRGKQLAQANGCFACHGTSETDFRGNLRQVTGGTWKPKGIPTFWENGIDRVDVLVDWITHGVPEEEAEAHKKLFIQMPAYEKHMATGEIEDVAAWILSEAVRLSQGAPSKEATPVIATADVSKLPPERLMPLGDRLSRQHGCYQCHGELGQGGASNPASFKNYIPGFFGRDFLKLTDNGNREEVLHWIEHGRGKAVESGALGYLAKKYVDGQAIGMPAYKDRLTPLEKTVLTEYLLLLNKEGPLSASKLEKLLKTLNEDGSDES